METTVTKNKNGYGYKYTDLTQIHEYLESNNMRYIQIIKRLENDDYIFTKRYIDGKWEEEWLQGCKVVQAILSGKSNPAQEQGSALTYARRYSLLMAFGLATEDDDAQSLTRKLINLSQLKIIQTYIKSQTDPAKYYDELRIKYKVKELEELTENDFKKIMEEKEK